jgi:hypothetical protein
MTASAAATPMNCLDLNTSLAAEDRDAARRFASYAGDLARFSSESIALSTLSRPARPAS